MLAKKSLFARLASSAISTLRAIVYGASPITEDVLRKGLGHGKHHIDLFYGTQSPENTRAVDRHAANRFSITRQLHYSREQSRRSLDLALFINGLPVATFELKNSLTKQTAEDAEEQYKCDRDPRETLFQFGRCVVHFALDDHEVRMCTALKGDKGTARESWFLPFNQGWNQGAGNPPNPYGIKTDYLWRRILTPGGLTDILENYAQVVARTSVFIPWPPKKSPDATPSSPG